MPFPPHNESYDRPKKLSEQPPLPPCPVRLKNKKQERSMKFPRTIRSFIINSPAAPVRSSLRYVVRENDSSASRSRVKFHVGPGGSSGVVLVVEQNSRCRSGVVERRQFLHQSRHLAGSGLINFAKGKHGVFGSSLKNVYPRVLLFLPLAITIARPCFEWCSNSPRKAI